MQGAFRCALDVILSTVHMKFALVNLDNIVIFLKRLDVHIKHLSQDLTLPRDGGITVSPGK